MNNWHSTVWGVLTIAGAAISMLLLPLLDSDPATLANVSGFMVAAGPGFGLLFTADAWRARSSRFTDSRR